MELTINPPQGDLGDFRWSLVRTPDQKALDNPTNPPAPQFSSVFIDASLDDLATHFKSRKFDRRAYSAFWNENSFGIIDQRSVQDSTMSIAIWWNSPSREHFEAEVGGDEEAMERWVPTGWHSIRVSFEDAAYVSAGNIENDFIWIVENKGAENYDANGVLLPQER